MAPSRKSRSVNKRFSGIDEVDTNDDAEYASKSRQMKRKWTGKIGPKWTKEELERFYKAFRKHGKDWEKVAAVVRSRSVGMVEALYSMNTAYLSLPKGYASAAGLIAMMTDHYSNQVDSDSEQDVNEGPSTSHKPQKRARTAKGSVGSPVADLSKSLSAASNYGCLSLLKRRRSESRPWAVGKRTPRVPVSYSYDKDKEERYISPIRQGLKFKGGAFDDDNDDDGDDDVAHRLALALTVASQRGTTPQVSQALTRKRGSSSSAQNGEQMRADSEMTSAKLRCSEMDDSGCEPSLGSTEAETGDYTRDKRFLKGKRYQRWRSEPEESMDNHLDEIKEACSGTEEGQKPAGKGRFDAEVTNAKLQRSSYDKVPKKRSKKVLFGEGEDIALDALQTLADLSLRLPEDDTESSVHVQVGKTVNVAKSKLKGNSPASGVKVTPSKSNKQAKSTHKVTALPELEKGHQVNAGPRKRRNKPPQSKTSENEQHSGPDLGESQKVKVVDDVNTNIDDAKPSHDAASGKQKRSTKLPELTSSNADPGRESIDSGPSAAQVVSSSQLILPTKVRSRRKISTPKPLLEKDTETCENITHGQFQDRALTAKEKLSNCLSRYGPRQWCVFEWFYSAIDYPWFARREFVAYLDHVGLGHIPRLTRVEWGVIRGSLGKPRRFSEHFLKEEKEKLHQYRDSVREHYTELRAGTREGLPTDLARPLSVGQRVIAIHPRTREIHNGSVLTVDRNRCCVRFDRPELGFEFVMDVDCMPLNPEENFPASLTRHGFGINKYIENLNECKTQAENAMEGYIKLHQENMDATNGFSHIPPPNYHALRQSQGVSLGLATPVTPGLGETIHNQAANGQPSIHAHLQAKEADIQALAELTRALEKKDAVVSELKRLNEDVLESQNNGEKGHLRDSESFKKHYAAVLLQLNEINDQLSSALSSLRQRNTYQVITPAMPMMTAGGDPVLYFSSFNHPTEEVQDSASHVAEIVETSRSKAQIMVDAAMQAVRSLNKQGSNMESIEEAIDFVNNQLSLDDLSTQSNRPPHPENSTQDQSSSCTTNAEANHTSDTKPSKNLSDLNEAQIPSDLISQSVATLLMIQKCTEREFPPSDVAQVLGSAVANLKPSCSQNLPVYADIQKCMGIIRTQILARVPT
ncbi:Protein ALWAYS EARLY 3 [Linum grandiflorum]